MTELIVALDLPDFAAANTLVERTRARVRWYKVGYQAFYEYGARIIDALRECDASLFLDLKLHDIPSTAGAAVRALARFRPAMTTLHSAGGADMMAAAAVARDEANASGADMRLLAVTVLTSLSQQDLVAVGEAHATHELVAMRAELALRAGIDGLVCAVDEVAVVRARAERPCIIVCPGIRPSGESGDDQRRVATPRQAALAGADYIVVGRPIAAAQDPASVAEAVVAELAASKPLGLV
jgi:orotidine-5'-phosphate decarboxylase